MKNKKTKPGPLSPNFCNDFARLMKKYNLKIVQGGMFVLDKVGKIRIIGCTFVGNKTI
jgi:hypothetical protein